MDISNIERSVKFSRWLIPSIFLFLVILHATWFWGLNDRGLSLSSSDWGAFGDFVGGVINPLIAFFAFYWLTISVVIQKQEMAETRIALVESKMAQEKLAENAMKSAHIEVLRMRHDAVSGELEECRSYRKYLHERDILTEAQGQFKLPMFSLPWSSTYNFQDACKKIDELIDELHVKQTNITLEARSILGDLEFVDMRVHTHPIRGADDLHL